MEADTYVYEKIAAGSVPWMEMSLDLLHAISC